MTTNPLSHFEKQYVNIFGRLYEQRGLPKGLGQIYAILALKANTPDTGIDQQILANLIDRSVSTVSRLLNTLVGMKYCDYVETINENNRRERKYYMIASIKEIAIRRFNHIKQENKSLKKKLHKLRNSIDDEEKKKNRDFLKFLDNLDMQIEKLDKFYSKTIEISDELL